MSKPSHPSTLSVGNYLNGDWINEKTHFRVYFSSHKEKAEYLRGEHEFCHHEEVAFHAAWDVSERTKTRKDMLTKRVAFAKHMGYSPKAEHSQIWVKQQTDNITGIA